MKPFIKWAGGKRTLAEEIVSHIGTIKDGAKYLEPFLGGGAVLLFLQPKNAICSDVNPELINLYNVIKRKPHKLISTLKEEYFSKHCTEHYFAVRNIDRDKRKFSELTDVQRAARFLYLNKTCYNGLWRVNSKGENNVPMGRYKNPCIISEDEILEISQYFRESNIKFILRDYKGVLDDANTGDVVYFDPPYDIENEQNGFVSYAKDGFTRDDQRDLRDLCLELIRKGVTVIVSNSNTSFIRSIYSEGPEQFELLNTIEARRSIGRSSNSRKKINELLIIGRP